MTTDERDAMSTVEEVADVGRDADGIPYCRKHHCRMIQKSGGKKNSRTAYYGCKVDGCNETAKYIRAPKSAVVPTELVTCPRCKEHPVCERNEKYSNAQMVILSCPLCGWKSNGMPSPHLASFMDRQRHRHTTEEELGGR